MNLEQRLAAFDQADLYVVITEAFCAEAALEVRDDSAAGVRLMQLREKEWRMARCMGNLDSATDRGRGALLIVDDRVDIALATGADGVHLGQDDLPLDAARRLAPELIIGASTHSLEEALAAQEAGASYLNIGPIFATQTKSIPAPLGPEAIDQIAPRLRIPWTTMGGIKSVNISQVVRRGARHPAVMTAVTAALDPTAAALQLRQMIKERGPAA
jgi:thiamine-phosphate pyrophosphorylase